MDQQRLQAHAAELEQLLARLAPTDGEVADLRSALEPLLALAGSGALSAPLPWGDIPGGVTLRKAACASTLNWSRHLPGSASKRPVANRRPCASCAASCN